MEGGNHHGSLRSPTDGHRLRVRQLRQQSRRCDDRRHRCLDRESAGELAASATDLAADAVDASTTINLQAGWFRDNYELLLPIGLTLTVGTFCLQLVLAAWRRDERALARAAVGTMTGVLFSFCAVSFTAVAVTVVDVLSAGLFEAANTSVEDAVRRIVKITQLGVMYQLGWAVPALVGLGSATGAFLYWGVMVARKVGVLVLVALAVFAGAGGGWEAAKRWRRGWIEATATLVVSKLLMSVVFLIGVSAIGESDATDGIGALSDALAGIVVMGLVLLCPYATYKFVRWASDGGGHDDLHRTGFAGVTTAVGAAKTAGSLAMRMDTGSPAPQGPGQVPSADPDGVSSEIDPTGRISKEGIDSGPPKPQTSFRYGEAPNASGDKGRALIQHPGIPALVTRPSGTGGSTPAGDDAAAPGAGTAAPGGTMTRVGSAAPTGPAHASDPAASGPAPAEGTSGRSTPPPTGPPPTGSPAPTRWVYPEQPPSGS